MACRAVPAAAIIPTRDGRNVIVAPDGAVIPGAPRQATTIADPTLLKALARPFRWKRMRDEGRYSSVSDIARAEKIDGSYAGCILRLTLLAPETAETVVEGRQPVEMGLPALLEPWPVAWKGQRK